jgi:hypothetical protein
MKSYLSLDEESIDRLYYNFAVDGILREFSEFLVDLSWYHAPRGKAFTKLRDEQKNKDAFAAIHAELLEKMKQSSLFKHDNDSFVNAAKEVVLANERLSEEDSLRMAKVRADDEAREEYYSRQIDYRKTMAAYRTSDDDLEDIPDYGGRECAQEEADANTFPYYDGFDYSRCDTPIDCFIKEKRAPFVKFIVDNSFCHDVIHAAEAYCITVVEELHKALMLRFKQREAVAQAEADQDAALRPIFHHGLTPNDSALIDKYLRLINAIGCWAIADRDDDAALFNNFACPSGITLYAHFSKLLSSDRKSAIRFRKEIVKTAKKLAVQEAMAASKERMQEERRKKMENAPNYDDDDVPF